MVHKDQ